MKVVDYRYIKEPSQILATLQGQSSTMLWAEGEGKNKVEGKDRNELKPAGSLAIWTIPPSPDELRAGLAKVQPQTVYLFAVTDPVELAEAFMGRLFGLLKYVINQRAGKVTYSELETATAQRAVTVRKGVQWLVSQGEIDTKIERADDLVVHIGASLKDPAGASRLWAEIQALLAETAAYRAHFKRADKDILFD